MNIWNHLDQSEYEKYGLDMHRFASEVYPLCRSITGDGVRKTLKCIRNYVPLNIYEVNSGTQVFDWTVPKEWNIREAYIKGPDGCEVANYRNNNLHIVSYSIPVHQIFRLNELKEHLYTLPEHPEWIPYRTAYYKPEWGFCLKHSQLLMLEDGEYEVVIDTSFSKGSMTYGEYYIKGEMSDEVMISTHLCHPSLANDNLSGICVAIYLAQILSSQQLRYSYRFVFVPGTIGAIAWLAKNKDSICRIKHGLVLSCLGDKGGFHYKKSRDGHAEIDKIVAHVFRYCGESSEVIEFAPTGYDERQYGSPGINLPVGCLMRSIGGAFPEYHTSADNLDFIRPIQLARSLNLCVNICSIIEGNQYYINLNPCCEPQLSRRNLYRDADGKEPDTDHIARLWVLNLSDGKKSLLEVAERSGLSFDSVYRAAKQLMDGHLLTIKSSQSK